MFANIASTPGLSANRKAIRLPTAGLGPVKSPSRQQYDGHCYPVYQELGRRALCRETAHSHIDDMGDLYSMKKIGFLSFGHWAPSPQSRTQSASDALLQSIDLAVEAERLGMDGAYFRVHHFAQQLACLLYTSRCV